MFEANGIGQLYGRGSFDFHAPGAVSLGDYTIDLDLIFIPVMPKASFRLQAAGLDRELLNEKGLQKMSKPRAILRPCGCHPAPD